jgi:ribonuclease HI
MNQLKNPFMRIGGRTIFPLPILTYVQTDGSFRQMKPKARVATIIQTPAETYRCMIPIDAYSSTEAEWASVLFGLTLALEKNCEAIAVENDNLGVIRALVMPQPRLRHEYARFYHNQILTQAKETAWTGARWIPREQNKADDLFR